MRQCRQLTRVSDNLLNSAQIEKKHKKKHVKKNACLKQCLKHVLNTSCFFSANPARNILTSEVALTCCELAKRG